MQINPNSILEYARKHRKGEIRAAANNIVGGRLLIDVLSTQVGQVLLGDAVSQMDSLCAKILANQSTEAEHSLYLAYRDIISMWAKRIYEHDKSLDRVKGAKNGR